MIPGGCTGYVQPLDIAINKPLKTLVKAAADMHYERNEEAWESGRYKSVSERRILLTHWVAEAWEKLHQDYKMTIVKSFRSVGLSLNPDGSEDEEICIKGVEDIEVGDWQRDSAPVNLLDDDEMESGAEELASSDDDGPARNSNRRAEKQRNDQRFYFTAAELDSEMAPVVVETEADITTASEDSDDDMVDGSGSELSSLSELDSEAEHEEAKQQRKRKRREQIWNYFQTGPYQDFQPETVESRLRQRARRD